jgi:hypothetical protein
MTFTIQSAKTAVLALTIGFGAILQGKTAEARDIEKWLLLAGVSGASKVILNAFPA